MWKSIAIACCLFAGCKSSSDDKPAAPTSESANAEDGTATAQQPSSRVKKIEVPRLRPSQPEVTDDGERHARGPRDPAKWEERRKERDAAMDTDGDGVVSDKERAAAQEQRQAVRQARLADWHKKLDTDGDGKVTKEELANSRFRRLDPEVVDTNHDGVITLEELEAAAPKIGGGRRGMPGRPFSPLDGDGKPATGATPPAPKE